MAPGQYTELFFLDEATALAAGHRPCAECRHARFLDFCAAWGRSHPGSLKQRPTADEIDGRLHAERVATDRTKGTFRAALHELPNGVFVTLDELEPQAYLVWGNYLFRWSPAGYVEPVPRPESGSAVVLTPPSTAAAIRVGYAPEVHASVHG